MSAALLAMHGVHLAYPGGRQVLEGVDFALADGERVAIVGANGAGKTTLLHLLVGLRRPTAGTITAFGSERRGEADFREVRTRVGLLFQDPDDQLFCPTVLEDVAFGPLNLGRSRRDAVAIAERTLGALGLTGFGDRITHKLSGGEKRLVSLASVLAMEPEVLLLDEATNGLDADSHARLTELLRGLPQAIAFVSHDERLIASLATRAVLMTAGRLAEASLHAHPHRHVHTHPHLHLPAADGDDHAGGIHELTHFHGAESLQPPGQSGHRKQAGEGHDAGPSPAAGGLGGGRAARAVSRGRRID